MGTQFGGPGGGRKVQKPIPPERGSFPLDHDAECKSFMGDYLTCLKKNRGHNATECRVLSKQYLTCRMEHNLMAPDEFKNLGYGKEFDESVKALEGGQAGAAAATPLSSSTSGTFGSLSAQPTSPPTSKKW